jgi:multiple sugar transport system substrate-binding protein
MKHKAIVVSLILVMAAGIMPLLAGGGAQAGGDASKPVVLSIWTRQEEDQVGVFFKRFMEKYPNIKLEPEYIPGGKNHINKLIAAVTAGTQPDVTALDAIATKQLVQMEALVPLDDWIKNDPEINLSNFAPGHVKTGSINNKQYALPFGGDASLVAYNKSLFRERGLDPDNPPKTWDEFIETAKKLTFDRNGDGTIDVYGFIFVPSVPSLTTYLWLPYFWMAGGEFENESQKKFVFNSESGYRALNYLMDMHLKHKVVPPTAIGAAATMDTSLEFLQGRVAMFLSGPGIIGRVKRDAPNLDLGLMTHPIPSSSVKGTSFCGGDNICILEGIPKEKVAAAQQVLKYLVSAEGQKCWWETKVFLPIRNDLMNDPYYTQNPLEKVSLQAYLNSHDPPRTAHYVEVQQYLRDAFEQVAIQGVSAKDALDGAAKKANELVERSGEL